MSENDPSWPNETSGTPGDGSGGTPPPPSGGTPPPPPPPSSPQAGGGFGARSTATSNADLGIRFGARVIDAIILGIITTVVLVPIVIGAMFANSAEVSTVPGLGGGSLAVNFVAGLLGLLISFAYYVGFETTKGWTPGKRIVSLQVRGATGGNPTVEESVKRNAWLALSIIPVLGGVLQLAAAIWIAVSINGDDENQGVHDEFAGGTHVVRA